MSWYMMNPSSSGIQGRWRRGRRRNVTCCSRGRWWRRERSPARKEDIGVGNYACLQGRWKMWEHHQNAAKIYLQLVFACEGGGGVGSVERVFEGRCWRCALCRMWSHVPRRYPVSHDVFHLAKTYTPSRNPSTLTLGGLHPSLEGRGQVAESLGVDGPKRNEKY